jgi:Zn-dependent protease with chaperone function
MILPYMARLFCISLAAFFALHLTVGLVIWLVSPRLIDYAFRMIPRRGAAFLLLARFIPVLLTTLVVVAFCIPSYVLLEPESSAEELSLASLLFAAGCVLLWCLSIGRGISATLRSNSFLQRCNREGLAAEFAGERSPALIIDAKLPILALGGIFHHRLVVSRRILDELTTDQLSAALLHERAHRASRDNLKRLLFRAAPEILPFVRMFGSLEAAWARLAEWAADDAATSGDAARSIDLAAALIRVARLGTVSLRAPLCTSLLPNADDLTIRVDRLLSNNHQDHRRSFAFLLAPIGVGILVCPASQPAILAAVHSLLEFLTH